MHTSLFKQRPVIESRSIPIAVLAVLAAASLLFAMSCVEESEEAASAAYATGAQSEALPAAAAQVRLVQNRTAPLASPSAVVGWVRHFGSAGADSAKAVAADGSAVYVVGATSGSFDSQPTSKAADAYIQKYDTSGGLQWTRQVGTDAADKAQAVVAADGSVYVAGTTGGTLSERADPATVDGFLRKFDEQGRALWTRQIDLEMDDVSLDDAIRAVTVFDDAVYVVGESTSSTSRSARSRSLAFIRSYSADGQRGWSDQFFVDDRSSRAWDVAANGDGVYVSGDTPSMTSASLARWDAFVRKYDAEGSWKFTRLFDMNEQVGPDTAVSVVVDEAAAYIIGESFETAGESRRTHFVRKLDANGNFEWTRDLEKPPRAIALESGMLYLATGTPANLFAGQAPEDSGIDVQKYDTTGQILWTRRLNASGPLRANALAVSGPTIYVAGSTDGAFAGKTNAGGEDAFIARLIEPVDRKRRRR